MKRSGLLKIIIIVKKQSLDRVIIKLILIKNVKNNSKTRKEKKGEILPLHTLPLIIFY